MRNLPTCEFRAKGTAKLRLAITAGAKFVGGKMGAGAGPAKTVGKRVWLHPHPAAFGVRPLPSRERANRKASPLLPSPMGDLCERGWMTELATNSDVTPALSRGLLCSQHTEAFAENDVGPGSAFGRPGRQVCPLSSFAEVSMGSAFPPKAVGEGARRLSLEGKAAP